MNVIACKNGKDTSAIYCHFIITGYWQWCDTISNAPFPFLVLLLSTGQSAEEQSTSIAKKTATNCNEMLAVQGMPGFPMGFLGFLGLKETQGLKEM